MGCCFRSELGCFTRQAHHDSRISEYLQILDVTVVLCLIYIDIQCCNSNSIYSIVTVFTVHCYCCHCVTRKFKLSVLMTRRLAGLAQPSGVSTVPWWHQFTVPPVTIFRCHQVPHGTLYLKAVHWSPQVEDSKSSKMVSWCIMFEFIYPYAAAFFHKNVDMIGYVKFGWNLWFSFPISFSIVFCNLDWIYIYIYTLYIISPQSSSIIHHPSCNISFVVFDYTYLYILLFCLLLFCILYYLLFIIYYNYIYIHIIRIPSIMCSSIPYIHRGYRGLAHAPGDFRIARDDLRSLYGSPRRFRRSGRKPSELKWYRW